MEVSLRESYDTTRDLRTRAFRSVCYAPFVSMYFRTSGEVVACCKSQTLVLGNVGEQRLGEIWNGARYGALRKALVAYELPTGCEFCAWQLGGGDLSGVFARMFDDYPVEDKVPQWPAVMEFSVSNVCNFECVQCDGESSSLIRARRERMPPLANPYGDRFYEDLREFLPHLRIAKFLGGEPFLSAGCFRIFESMIGARLTMPCFITTNGSQYNERVERVLDNLPVSIIFSIDGLTKATLEAIRVNARHEVLMENARRFVDYTKRRGTVFLFSFCVMRRNWHEFGDFLLFAESLGVGTNVCTVTNPVEESLYTLSIGQLRNVLSQLERQGDALLPRLTLNRRAWLEILASLRVAASESQIARATQMCKTMNDAKADDPLERALAFERSSRTEEALAEAERVPASHPWRYVALVLVARLNRTLRRLDRCEPAISAAIAMAPARPEAMIERAWLRLEQQQHEEGLKDVERVRASLASWPKFEADLCEVSFQIHFLTGRGDDAQRELDRLFELERDRARPFVLRGWAFHAMGRDTEAKSDAQNALALDPTNDAARRLAALV